MEMYEVEFLWGVGGDSKKAVDSMKSSDLRLSLDSYCTFVNLTVEG